MSNLKLEVGKRYRTRGGDEVEILKTDMKGNQPVIGVVTRSNGSQFVSDWSLDGAYYIGSNESESNIISEIKPKRVVWLNVFYDGTCRVLSTKEEADSSPAANCRIARVRIEFEEGQFDE